MTKFTYRGTECWIRIVDYTNAFHAGFIGQNKVTDEHIDQINVIADFKRFIDKIIDNAAKEKV